MKKNIKCAVGLALALICLLALQVIAFADTTEATVCETVLPSADALPDSDTLLAGYLEHQLYGMEDAACFGRPAYASLSELEARIYHEAAVYVKEVAAGTLHIPILTTILRLRKTEISVLSYLTPPRRGYNLTLNADLPTARQHHFRESSVSFFTDVLNWDSPAL